MLGFFVCLFICLFFLFFVARVCRAARLCSHLRTGGWVYWKSFHPRDLMWHWGHNPHTWVGLNTSLRHRNTKHYLDLWRKCSFLIFYRRSILPRKHPFHLYQEVENSLLNLSMLGIKSSVNFTPLIFFFFFLWLHLQQMEVPGLVVKPELQLPVYTTATATLESSCICNLGQHQILNPLTEAWDWTCILMDTMSGF